MPLESQAHSPELADSIVRRIQEATDEALGLFARPDATVRVTVIRGYLHLCTITSKRTYVEGLSRALAEFSEFAMERGRHTLARRLLSMADEIRIVHLLSAGQRATS
jgi:hypothetical protein